jgi:hypothetical protein
VGVVAAAGVIAVVAAGAVAVAGDAVTSPPDRRICPGSLNSSFFI